MTLQKEGNSHLRNTSKYFESVTTFTFTSSKSIIAKENEVEQIQEEDDILLEINQQREDKSEFFEKIYYQFIRKEWLLIRKNMLYIVLKPNKTYEKSKIKALMTQCIQEIQFHSVNTKLIDINHLMKIKIINHHDEQLSSFFHGVIFRKNVALKQMQYEINKPALIIIIGEFDMEGQLEDYIQNKKKVDSINQIYNNHEPNLILVEKGTNKIALDECLRRILLFQLIQKKSSLNIYLYQKNALLKERNKQKINLKKQFPKVLQEKAEIQKDSTLCFLKASTCQKFDTITISGPQEDLLSKVKSCFIRCARLQLLNVQCIKTINQKLFRIKVILQHFYLERFLFKNYSIQYQKHQINYVIDDVNNFNDIKDFSSLEEYESKHPSQRDKLEEFQ
ncbi:unnamed protein product [Paramecium primaurelia]|uniref:Uncharacterized protein n=1 Tax=Paramecium primaurelia TaxID=5886 RepID=A0A8S1LPZ1_PARPR|nr:unnamed protein product [Paramecium primaurelia]